MGEAKRRAAQGPSVVYHHTSQIRTNLIWMSGVIQLEGLSRGASHPLLGDIQTDVQARRACKDFPPLAWFSRSVVIPKVLLNADIIAYSKETGERLDIEAVTGMDRQAMANGLALRRMAIGFPNDPAIFTPWREHFGYDTPEGRELNDTARDAGDDPDMWYVAEVPVDVLRSTEVWTSRNVFHPRLERMPTYLQDVHRMVRLCRATPGAYIPPSWIGDSVAEEMLRQSKEPGFKLAL